MPMAAHLFRRYGKIRISPASYNSPLATDTQRIILEKRKEKSRLVSKLDSKS